MRKGRPDIGVLPAAEIRSANGRTVLKNSNKQEANFLRLFKLLERDAYCSIENVCNDNIERERTCVRPERVSRRDLRAREREKPEEEAPHFGAPHASLGPTP